MFDGPADAPVDMPLLLRPGRGRSHLLTRRIVGALLALLVIGSLTASSAGADTQAQLNAAKAQLDRLTSQIDSENQQLARLQPQLDVLAGQPRRQSRRTWDSK